MNTHDEPGREQEFGATFVQDLRLTIWLSVGLLFLLGVALFAWVYTLICGGTP